MRLRPVYVAVALAAVQVLLLAPIWRSGAPAGDDLSIHLSEVACFVRALRVFDVDVWCESGNSGYPGALVYQSLPQFVTALVALITSADLSAVFKLSVVVPLVLTPVAVYRALVVLGAPRAHAAAGATAVTFLFCDWPYNQYSVFFDSMFVQGLWTQAWGTLFYPLALAYTIRHLEHGDKLAHATIYGLLTGLSHPFLAISLVPAVLVTGPYRVKRGVVLAGVVLVASAFFWAPILTGFDDFGAFPFRLVVEAGMPPSAFVDLVRRGAFLDHGRLPIIQACLLGALYFSISIPIVRKLLLQGGVLLLLMIAGTLIGDSEDNLFAPIRFTPAMQISLASAAGYAAAEIGRRLILRNDRLRPVVLVAAGLIFAYLARHAVERGQVTRVRVVSDFVDVRAHELDDMLAALAELPHGRVEARGEAGTGNHWWMYLPYVYASKPSVRSYGGASRQGSPTYLYLHEDIDLARHYRVYAVRYLLDRTVVDRPRLHRFQVHRAAIDRGTLERTLLTSNATVADGPFGYLTVTTTTAYVETRERVLRATTSTMPTWQTPGGPLARVRHRTPSFVLSELPIRGFVDFKETITPVPKVRDDRRSAGLAWLAGAGPTTWSDRGRLASERWSPSRYEAQVEVADGEPLWLVFAASHHRGWRATVDGEEAAITRVMPASMAIRVPPGRHEVVWRYERPVLFWWLLALAGLTVAGVVYYARRASRWEPGRSTHRSPSDQTSS